jgi:hypothetical protein
VWLNFIVSELHLACVGNLVDCILVFVGGLEHIIGGIPASMNIMGHHAWFKRELLQNMEPPRESLCYCLDKQLNCLVVGVTPSGSAVRMTRVSYTSHAFVRDPVGGHRLSWSVLAGCLSLKSG